MMSPDHKKQGRMTNQMLDNEGVMIDNPSIFLRTPSYKGNFINSFMEGNMGNSENKMNVSPFFNKK